jgi:predicted ATPase
LPLPLTSLVGRDELLAEIAALADAGRLVTLVGPGGVGKTRLLLELGQRLRAARPDRPVVLGELAHAEPDEAADAVASALGIDARPGASPIGRIVEVLGDTEAVLLLDNCEHVLDPAAELVEQVLARCPGVTVVATSRERLRVPGERVCQVPTLLAGDGEATASELFVERARAARSGFEPDDAERECIAEIVRRLDGLPLAIELAAARLHTHDVAEVAAGLDQRFSLLSAGSRTSTRHSSLAAAVSWSLGLLDDDLRRAFVSLAVFSSPFTAADAAVVCGLEVEAATGALVELVERSLVLRAPGRRFVLLETLRAFGVEQLLASGQAELVHDRHARRVVDWVEDADARLLEPGDRAIAEIDDGVPELRTALDWLVEHGQVEAAGRLVVALLDYGLYRLRPDVLAWAARVAAADPDDASPLASRVWAVAAYAAWMAGDVAECGVRSERALQAAERAGSVPSEVATIRGNYELFEGRLAEAEAWYRRAVDAAVDDPPQRLLSAATALLPLGYAGDPRALDLADALLREVGDTPNAHAAYIWFCAGEVDLSFDVDRAHARLGRAVELAEVTRASFVRGTAGASKASIEARVGDPEVAAADYRWLIAHWRRAGMWSTQWTMLRSIASLLARLGRHRDAAVLEGSVRATAAGHRIFGADEVALAELSTRLREVLGEESYEAARREGARLDGDAAVEHALRSL